MKPETYFYKPVRSPHFRRDSLEKICQFLPYPRMDSSFHRKDLSLLGHGKGLPIGRCAIPNTRVMYVYHKSRGDFIGDRGTYMELRFPQLPYTFKLTGKRVHRLERQE